jgi:hypothetical protein
LGFSALGVAVATEPAFWNSVFIEQIINVYCVRHMKMSQTWVRVRYLSWEILQGVVTGLCRE